MLIVELEELEPLVSRRIIKTQNRLFTRDLRFRAFGEIPRNTIKLHLKSCTFRVRT